MRKLGADRPIDYKNEKFEEVVKDIDLVYDLIAGDTQKRSFAVLKDGGTLISTLAEARPGRTRPPSRARRPLHGQARRRELEEIARLIDAGKVKVIVNAIYPLEEVARAHTHMENDHIQGKVVLQVAA